MTSVVVSPPESFLSHTVKDNPYAYDVLTPKYKMRVVRSRKHYSRKKDKDDDLKKRHYEASLDRSESWQDH